jgi:DNA-binding NtrC family response regulator
VFVDDEQAIRFTLPRILAKNGFEVTTVANVNDALAEIRTAKFDILLSDLNLPEANSGFVVIDEMRKTQPACVNFVLTGFPADETFKRAAGH